MTYNPLHRNSPDTRSMNKIKIITTTLIVSLLAAWLVTFLALSFENHKYTELTEEQLKRAAAYLEGKLTPTPPGWKWSVYSPQPGVNLRSGMIDADNAKGTVVVVPGFTATIEMTMREIVKINAAGYRVASLEYRGQGESYRPLANPEKGYVESFAQLGEELATFARQSRVDGKPLFFYAISKGAHITMRMAGEHNPDADGYALIVPMIKISTGKSSYSVMRFVAGVFHAIGLGRLYVPGQAIWPNGELSFGKPIPCNANPVTAQTREALFATRENLRTNGVTMSWLHKATESTEVLLSPQHMAAIHQPVKMFTAGVDELVDTQTAEAFCNSLAQCEVRHFANSRHCITRENFALYDTVIEAAIELFDQQQ
ncbi:MAG: alpha/beta hydrolase [Gammaproteobacteria bacterium]|nr:alpha/beta hydrolase [Gammaproteobacteria bacterium]